MVMAPMGYSNVEQAKNSSTFLYTKSDVSRPADVYVSSNLKKETKLSAINAQQKDYNWFSAEPGALDYAEGLQRHGRAL
ncbi:hypothetical protein ACFQT0_13960 [Hymenobacter humi]|uniref:Uncharacterized protein n=1 Tax=Hymenobacter humi TaxID=1411620 RepID=A0ABW2U7M4_9BACT